jgi:mRNA interferase MazF
MPTGGLSPTRTACVAEVTVKRGELWWVDHDPAIGSEAAMTRPALVVSSDSMNKHARTVIVCPLTSSVHRVYNFEVFIPQGEGNLDRDSKAQPQLLRAIDKQRLERYIGRVSENTMVIVTEAIAVQTGMRD